MDLVYSLQAQNKTVYEYLNDLYNKLFIYLFNCKHDLILNTIDMDFSRSISTILKLLYNLIMSFRLKMVISFVKILI